MKKPVKETSHTHDLLSDIVAGLTLTTETAIDASGTLAVLFRDAAEYRVEHMRLLSEAEMNMDRVKAEEEIEMRTEAETSGLKLTENAIKAHLLLNPKVQTATAAYYKQEALTEYAKLMLDAVRMKKDGLRAMTDLTAGDRAVARLIGTDADVMKNLRDKITSKYPGSKA